MSKKERNISDEQLLLELLIKSCEKQVGYKLSDEDKKLCRQIGIFTYKIKETQKMQMSKLFLIKGPHDENIICNEDGKFIGMQNVIDQRKNEFRISQYIELNKKLLVMQIEKEMQKVNFDDETNGTANGGDGRDKGTKEHEEKEPEKKVQEEQKVEGKQIEIKDWSKDINLDYKPKFRLDMTINGFYLWQILQVEDKLKHKLPNGINETVFRNGYLTIVDSKELEQKDGKKRQAEDTFVISSYSGDAVIELDEQILEPRNLGGQEQRKQAELTRQRYEDGVEAKTPQTETETTRTSLYKIPNAHSNFSVAENWFLAVDRDKERMLNGTTPVDNYEKKVSFVQVSRNQSEYTSNEYLRDTVEYELDPIRENLQKNETEIKKEEELKARRPNETEMVRKEHNEDLVSKCLKDDNVRETFSFQDVKKMVDEYHNEGKDDDWIIKEVVIIATNEMGQKTPKKY